ncbi:MAG: indole-3-glycerol-phosphate synthase [Candidatus Melainabacteria bacterium]|nr:indole-3-glycerol-phosphate synthase [Candidatus Melainabacteria bacterium]
MLLEQIIANKRAEIELLPRAHSFPDRKDVQRASLKEALLREGGIGIIAEIKPASPSTGSFPEVLEIEERLSGYNEHACGISVLTDRKYFGGSLELLGRVAALTERPVLLKDFVMDRKQIALAQRFGASAVLLIVKILSRDLLLDLIGECQARGLEPLVEVNDERELGLATAAGAELILINNRNLETMVVDRRTTLTLAPRLEPGQIGISASGIELPEHIEELRGVARHFLIGSALMRAADPGALLAELKDPERRNGHAPA